MVVIRRGQRGSGKRFLEAVVTITAPGVITTNSGRYLNPPEECEASAEGWSGKPILVNHLPNARDIDSPGVWSRSGIGIILQPIFDGAAVTATALVDIGRVRAIDAGLRLESRILPRLLRGEALDVSAGYLHIVDNTAGRFEGQEYDGIRRDHQPKYLAVLTDNQAACRGACMRLIVE